MHLAVLRRDVSFFVDDAMSEVPLACAGLVLGVAAEREPDLVVECELLVPLVQLHVQVLIEVIAFAFGHRILIHVGEVLGQADHLGAFLCAFLDKPRARLIVLLDVLGRAELHDADNAAEIVLLRRQRVLVVRNSVQN